MAFQEFQSHASSMPDATESHDQPQQIQLPRSQPQQARSGHSGQQAPEMVPLSLELVPPVLCQSFGVPMPDSQFVQRNIMGFGVSNALRNAPDQLFRFGHAEQPYHPGQSLIADQSQLQYPAGQLTSLGPMGPLMYGLPAGDAVGFATTQHAHYANSVLQCNAAFSAQQQQQQQQQRHHCHSQSAVDGKGVAVPRPAYVDPNLYRHTVVQPLESRPELREDEMRGLKRPQAGIHPVFGGAYMEPVKRSRLVWTTELHQRFEEAVAKAGGIDVAVPKTVLEHMAVPGLTRDNVASHLQKHRMNVKKTKSTNSCRAAENTQTNSACATHSGTEDDVRGNGIRSDIPGETHIAEARLQSDPEMQTGKGTVSMSHLRSADTSGVSRRTAFTCPMQSGVNSAPDSRETIVINGCSPADNGPSASNIASSTRMNGSNGSNGNGSNGSNGNGSNGSNGNGSSTAEGNNFASNEGQQGSGQGANGVSSAAPPSCMTTNGASQEEHCAPAKCPAAIPQSAGS